MSAGQPIVPTPIEIPAAMAIVSFKNRALKRLFENDDARGISGRHVERIRDILLALDQAVRVDYMNSYPGWRLHPARILERIGFGNWRVIFRFDNGMAYDVDLVDYH
jgi:proteic killer suppression protein